MAKKISRQAINQKKQRKEDGFKNIGFLVEKQIQQKAKEVREKFRMSNKDIFIWALDQLEKKLTI